MRTTFPPRDLAPDNSSRREPGQLFCMAPLYREPNSDVGRAKVPIGMPPANEVENDGSETGAAGAAAGAAGVASGELLSGLTESVLLQPTRAMMAASTGTRNRAILRDNLKLWVIRG